MLEVIAQRKIHLEYMRHNIQKEVRIQLIVPGLVLIISKVISNGMVQITSMQICMEKYIVNLQQLVKEIRLKILPNQNHPKSNTLLK